MSEAQLIAVEIRQFVVDESNLGSPEIVQGNTDLQAAGILDSLFMISLVSFCEEKFGVEFEFDELTEDAFRSVSALSELVYSKCKHG